MKKKRLKAIGIGLISGSIVILFFKFFKIFESPNSRFIMGFLVMLLFAIILLIIGNYDMECDTNGRRRKIKKRIKR